MQIPKERRDYKIEKQHGLGNRATENWKNYRNYRDKNTRKSKKSRGRLHAAVLPSEPTVTNACPRLLGPRSGCARRSLWRLCRPEMCHLKIEPSAWESAPQDPESEPASSALSNCSHSSWCWLSSKPQIHHSIRIHVLQVSVSPWPQDQAAARLCRR